MRLEPELWRALAEIGEREHKDISSLVRKAEDEENPGGRTSAVRVFVLDYFRAAATECGHSAAGHGTLKQVETEVPASMPEPRPMMFEAALSAA
jgi:predicted DNA-binding ribbon-helix-helix protein